MLLSERRHIHIIIRGEEKKQLSYLLLLFDAVGAVWWAEERIFTCSEVIDRFDKLRIFYSHFFFFFFRQAN